MKNASSEDNRSNGWNATCASSVLHPTRSLGVFTPYFIYHTVFVNRTYDTVVNTQFHNFYGGSSARVLCGILMKDIGRWLLLKKYVGSSGGCWLWFIIGRRFVYYWFGFFRSLLVVLYIMQTLWWSDISYCFFVVGCDIYGLFRSYLGLLVRDPWDWTAVLFSISSDSFGRCWKCYIILRSIYHADIMVLSDELEI